MVTRGEGHVSRGQLRTLFKEAGPIVQMMKLDERKISTVSAMPLSLVNFFVTRVLTSDLR